MNNSIYLADFARNALDTYMTAVWRRAGEQEAMVADGTITQPDLEVWP